MNRIKVQLSTAMYKGGDITEKCFKTSFSFPIIWEAVINVVGTDLQFHVVPYPII